MLVGVIGSHELGTPKRVMQLEKMKQRETDHGETYLAADVVCWPSKTFSVLLMLPASSSSFPLLWTFWQLLTPSYQTVLCQYTLRWFPVRFSWLWNAQGWVRSTQHLNCCITSFSVYGMNIFVVSFVLEDGDLKSYTHIKIFTMWQWVLWNSIARPVIYAKESWTV